MAASEKKVQSFGSWPSPITAGLVALRLGLDDVQWAPDGQTLIWSESRSDRMVLVAQPAGEARYDLTDDQKPRGGVGYGGGILGVARQQNFLVFANQDGRLYRRELAPGRPYPITPVVGSGGVASPTISPDGQWVAYVYSDGQTDLIALVDSLGKEWPIQLVRGADFYMQPTWHPSGGYLAWVEWNHPNMPWDGTQIRLGRLEGNPPHVVEVQTIAGDPDTPVQQPLFAPDGRSLCFIEESGEWADLVLYELQTGQRKVLVCGDGFDIAPPAWVQGIRTIGWSPDSRRIYFIRGDGASSTLWFTGLDSGETHQIDTAPFTSLRQLSVSTHGEVAFLASSAQHADQVVRWDGSRLHTEANSGPSSFDPAYLPEPQDISWKTGDGQTAYGLYYPPTHPAYRGEGAPPAIFSIHGGPTSLASKSFRTDAPFFTSRGYAFVVVNYRGSTGYGRSYRHAMRRRWGDVDVEDTVACARALVDRGMAAPGRLIIMGGSAGGYTVLNSLVRYPGLFKAGICLFGVSNLFALDLDTHKFEKHYNASLVGPLPEAAERYKAWSPVYHADQIRDAIYIFQGSEDKVVPPSQSEEIVKALRARGTTYKYKLYEGEGHGFRKSETIIDYLNETERFLLEQVIYAP